VRLQRVEGGRPQARGGPATGSGRLGDCQPGPVARPGGCPGRRILSTLKITSQACLSHAAVNIWRRQPLPVRNSGNGMSTQYFCGAALVLAGLLSACNGETPAQRQVRAMLKDPDSAKFEFVASGRGFECGTVNAKNSFGGYTGAMEYLEYQGSAGVAESEVQSLAMAKCCGFLAPLGAGDVPWNKPGFASSCTGLPQAGWDFTKPIS